MFGVDQMQSTIREHRDGGHAGGVFNRYNLVKVTCCLHSDFIHWSHWFRIKRCWTPADELVLCEHKRSPAFSDVLSSRYWKTKFKLCLFNLCLSLCTFGSYRLWSVVFIILFSATHSLRENTVARKGQEGREENCSDLLCFRSRRSATRSCGRGTRTAGRRCQRKTTTTPMSACCSTVRILTVLLHKIYLQWY